MSQNPLNSLLIFLAILSVVGLIIFTGTEFKRNLELVKYKKRITELEKVIEEEKAKQAIEVSIRKEEKKKDSIALVELQKLREKDSKLYIRNIQNLIAQFKQYNDEEIDSLLYKEYLNSTTGK